MLRAGVFGLGALGRHHTRILGDLPGVERVGVYDPREEAARSVAAEVGARLFPSFEALAGEIVIAVLATPPVSHVGLGLELVGRGVHLLVEKPIAASLAEADRLTAAAAAA